MSRNPTKNARETQEKPKNAQKILFLIFLLKFCLGNYIIYFYAKYRYLGVGKRWINEGKRGLKFINWPGLAAKWGL